MSDILTRVALDRPPNPEPRTAAGGEGEDNLEGDYSSSSSSDDSDDSEDEEGGGDGGDGEWTYSDGGGGPGRGGSTKKLLKRGEELWMEVYNFATLVPMGNEWKKDKIFILLHLLLEFLEHSKLHDVAKLRSRFNQLLRGMCLFSTRERHSDQLNFAEELWVEAFYFATLVPMDLLTRDTFSSVMGHKYGQPGLPYIKKSHALGSNTTLTFTTRGARRGFTQKTATNAHRSRHTSNWEANEGIWCACDDVW